MVGGSPVVDALFARLDPYTFGADSSQGGRGRGKGAGGGRAGGRGRGRSGTSSTSSPGAGTSTQDAAPPAPSGEVVESLEYLALKEQRDNRHAELMAAIEALSLHGGRARQTVVDALVKAYDAASVALEVQEELEKERQVEREKERRQAEQAALTAASMAAAQVVVEAVVQRGNTEAEEAAMGAVPEAVAEGVAVGGGVAAAGEESTPSLQARVAAAEDDVLGDLPGQAPNAANQSGVGGWSGVVRSGGSSASSAAPSPVPSGGRRPELLRIDKDGVAVPYTDINEAYRKPTMRYWNNFEQIVQMLAEDMERWHVPPVTSPTLFIVDGSNVYNPKHKSDNMRMFKPGGEEIGMTTRSAHEAPGPAIIVMKHDDFDSWIADAKDPELLDIFFQSMRRLLSGDRFGMRPVWFLTLDISRINNPGDRGVEYRSAVDPEWNAERLARKARKEKDGVDDECRVRKWLAHKGGPPKPSDPNDTFPATQMVDEGYGGPEGQFSHLNCEWDDVMATKLVMYFNAKRNEAKSNSRGFAMRYVSKDTNSYKTPAQVAHMDFAMPELQKAFKYNLFRAVHPQTLRSAEIS